MQGVCYWGRYFLEVVRNKGLKPVSRAVENTSRYLQLLLGGSASRLVQDDAVQAGQAAR
jgi:hypothetical protein